MHGLVTVIGVLLAGVIAAPIALSSQDIVAWAGAPNGLGLQAPWDLFTFLALDAAAAVCVGMVVYAAWRGEPAGAFGLLVWLFAAASAVANYQHGSRPGAPGDAWWFFPAMSIAGPALLEVTVRRIRRWVQTTAGRYERPLPHFRVARWLVALPETAVAWRLAVTEGYSRPEDAIIAARLVRVVHPSATPDPTPEATATPTPRALVSPDTAAIPSPTRTGQPSVPPSPDTAQATPDPTTTRATPRQRTRRGRPTPSAADRLDQVYGDGLDPTTGRPWTSRPLAGLAGVHHGTAAAYLRKRRTPAPIQPTTSSPPTKVGGNGHGSPDDPARPAGPDPSRGDCVGHSTGHRHRRPYRQRLTGGSHGIAQLRPARLVHQRRGRRGRRCRARRRYEPDRRILPRRIRRADPVPHGHRPDQAVTAMHAVLPISTGPKAGASSGRTDARPSPPHHPTARTGGSAHDARP
jgi:hypothetical protein